MSGPLHEQNKGMSISFDEGSYSLTRASLFYMDTNFADLRNFVDKRIFVDPLFLNQFLFIQHMA